jgi:putative ATP-dependent endonuclease of OLD family
VIERFDPDRIVVLNRDDDGILTSKPIELGDDLKPKRYRQQRRQFAEAVLARGVLVVEGATEVATFLAIADALDADPATAYQHPDVAGLSLFDAGSDKDVPQYGPIFAALGKAVFGVPDTPTTPLTPEQLTKAQSFTIHTDIGYAGIEALLVEEILPSVQRKVLVAVAARTDYPAQCGLLPEPASDDQVRDLTLEILKKRKGPNRTPPCSLPSAIVPNSQRPWSRCCSTSTNA